MNRGGYLDIDHSNGLGPGVLVAKHLREVKELKKHSQQGLWLLCCKGKMMKRVDNLIEFLPFLNFDRLLRLSCFSPTIVTCRDRSIHTFTTFELKQVRLNHTTFQDYAVTTNTTTTTCT